MERRDIWGGKTGKLHSSSKLVERKGYNQPILDTWLLNFICLLFEIEFLSTEGF